MHHAHFSSKERKSLLDILRSDTGMIRRSNILGQPQINMEEILNLEVPQILELVNGCVNRS